MCLRSPPRRCGDLRTSPTPQSTVCQRKVGGKFLFERGRGSHLRAGCERGARRWAGRCRLDGGPPGAVRAGSPAATRADSGPLPPRQRPRSAQSSESNSPYFFRFSPQVLAGDAEGFCSRLHVASAVHRGYLIWTRTQKNRLAAGVSVPARLASTSFPAFVIVQPAPSGVFESYVTSSGNRSSICTVEAFRVAGIGDAGDSRSGWGLPSGNRVGKQWGGVAPASAGGGITNDE